ncbi:cytoplasmic dynein 2 intermediate chain 1 [Tribolium madens]|uniref:cytoplasmic dynein 2 intermediate chain 1 n=1 Tax=Tribolium madens TaxID=41895 RepID=UPI001CF76204|nr:cytoplasmic dynein 2 intermediate chain 1 [Tribolium madens]
MSTKKAKDAIPKRTLASTRTKKPTETTKKETPKIKTSSRLQKSEDDEDKMKRHVSKPINQTKRVKPTPAKKTTSSTRAPATPPSSRVTKTQFFPSKKMYSNALKSEKIPAKTKVINNDVSPETSSMSERPRTATLRKGSIVNNNIVGPDAPKSKVEAPPVEYEDDFDSYESDFEEYNSTDSTSNLSTSSTSESTESVGPTSATKRVSSAGTDDEKKLDSGNYELPESRHRQILDNIKESIEKENSNLGSNLGSLSDEGFEDGKSLQFINFLGAQRKYQHRKSVELRRKRGEEILSMIRLDHYSFTLFELPPVPYDIFIKYYGKSNSVQASVQTGDQTDEEIQTDEISYKNKWTQFPPCFTKIEDKEHFWELYKCDYLGVGGDIINTQRIENSHNENSLETFLLRAGNLILNLQMEANMKTNIETNKNNIPFSKGQITCDTKKLDFLKERPLNDVCFCANNSKKILTVHGPRQDSSNSFVCLWNISNISKPETMLMAFGHVLCCTCCFECPNLVLGGLNDGTLVVWDMKESTKSHKNVCEEIVKNSLVRSPTYSTEINHGHSCKIISVQSMSRKVSEIGVFVAHGSTEVCSLDEDGEVIVWSVISKEESRGRIVENQGLAHWGSVIITINVRISLKKLYPEIGDFNCTDLALSHFDSNNLYISTNRGHIIHCLTSGGKTGVKKFLSNGDSQANCVEMCPFSSQYFVAGFNNGNINFYSAVIERPLMELFNKETAENQTKVEIIQWSYNRPFIFYTKDITNTIHVWNLKASDMFPIYSIPFKENILRMKLSVITSDESVPEQTYMIIATDKGSVYVHLLSEDYDQQPVEDFEKDKKKFLSYIDRYV